MRTARGRMTAVLRSAKEPTVQQLQRFSDFLARTYQRKVPLHWEQDDALRSGFRLQAGSDVYDWTLDGRLRQFQDYLRQLQPGQDDILPLMRQAVEEWELSVSPAWRIRGRSPPWAVWPTPSTGRFSSSPPG